MKPKYIVYIVFFLALCTNAQQRLQKVSQSIKANKDVTLNLNTSYTNIEIETWNKNEVKVDAYLESKTLTKGELQDIFDHWEVKLSGTADHLILNTSGGKNIFHFKDDLIDEEAIKALDELQFVMAEFEVPEVPPFPEVEAFEIPEAPEFPEMPELPELPEGVNNIHFDYEAYKKGGESYLEEWSKEYEDKYGKAYRDNMEAWAREFAKTDFEQYSKDMEEWGKRYGEKFGKDYEAKIEAWGKEFSEKFDEKWINDIEAWSEKFGEEFADKMEQRAIEMEKRLEKNEKRLEQQQLKQEIRLKKQQKALKERIKEREKRAVKAYNRVKFDDTENLIKTIKIKMPKKTKLKVNVRHGELKFTSIINNLEADLAYSSLVATEIDGSKTSINASYSLVLVDAWNLGELKLNYVEQAQLKFVNRLLLNANSSNISVDKLLGNAIINGSFGDLNIKQIDDSFNNLNVILENSNAVIVLPEVNYNLQYQGKHTRFEHPKKLSNNSSFNISDLSSNKTIAVNAKYSNIVMQ